MLFVLGHRNIGRWCDFATTVYSHPANLVASQYTTFLMERVIILSTPAKGRVPFSLTQD